MERSRRAILKSSGAGIGLIMATGTSIGRKDSRTSNDQIRLRGDRDNPVKEGEIKRKKREVLAEARGHLAVSGGPVPDVSVNVPDGREIVAYNFDIINGTPSQWVGTVDSETVTGVAGTEDSSKGPVERILDRAATDVAEKERQHEFGRRQQDTVTQMGLDSWEDWNVLYDDRRPHEGSKGNSQGISISWKSDPNEYSSQGVELRTRIYPNRDPRVFKYNIKDNNTKFSYNDDVISHVEDYGPGNSVGSSSSSMDLSIDNEGTVSVGLSSSMTRSDLDIDNKSNTDFYDFVKHRYDVSGDLTQNTVRINQAALTLDTEPEAGSDFCDYSSITEFGNKVFNETLTQEATLLWE